MNNFIKVKDFFKNYEVEDLAEIKIKIENYIHRRIYRKLFPAMARLNDITLFRVCFLHSWIKLSNYDARFENVEQSILDLAIQSVKMMDFAKSPFDKFNQVSSSFLETELNTINPSENGFNNEFISSL